MSFKEYAHADIARTFVNHDEFGSKVNINGAEVSVVEDKDQLLYRIKKDYESMGLIIGDILFYVSTEEWGKIPHVSDVPKIQEAVSYNGKPCTITEVTPQDGMWEVILRRAGAY